MRTPRSTYRLQVTPDFDLHAAARVLPYLHDLGVDWVYLSPLLQATDGSTPRVRRRRPDARRRVPRRGRAGWPPSPAEARRLGMGVLVDIVPNHMGVADPEQNRWWWDLLRLGRGSAYADAFDVDWEAFGDRVMVPVLGDGGETPETAYPQPPAQHYELVSWRRGDSELNYRRFFTITTLAGVRVEEPWVFAESHREIGRWFAEGLVDGLRVDHPDGLRDPAAYLEDLARLTGWRVRARREDPRARRAPAHVVGDRRHDRVRRARAHRPGARRPRRPGTARRPRGAAARRARRLGRPHPRHQARGRRRAVAGRGTPDRASASSLVARPLRWSRCEERQRRASNHLDARGRRRRGPRELPRLPLVPPRGRRAPRASASPPRAASPPDLAHARSTSSHPCSSDPSHPAALRFQQTSGMVMAKGVEDCAFYRYSRLTSLNEVGGDPAHFAVEPVRLPRGDGRAAARLARRDDRDDDPRHQAQRGHPGADRRAGRAP